MSKRRVSVDIGRLVRILAVTKTSPMPVAHSDIGRRRLGLFFPSCRPEIVRNGGVVLGCEGKHFGRTFLAKFKRRAGVVFIQLSDQLRVVARINNYRNTSVILGRRAKHRRTPDVNILDYFIVPGVFPGDRLLKRIQIDHHKVDRFRLERGQFFAIFWVVAPVQQRAVYFRMQRFRPAVHHFGAAGERRNRNHLHPSAADSPHRTPGGYDFNTESFQFGRQFGNPGLVRDRNQRPFNLSLIGHTIPFLSVISGLRDSGWRKPQ